MLVDTHCHLDAAAFAEDRGAVVAGALAGGVSRIVVPAVELANFAAVRACCVHYAGCVPAYGIHPLYVGRAGAADLTALADWLAREAAGPQPPVAVGEIGLDFFVPGFDAACQQHFYLEQLKIARAADLPVLLHVRRAVDQVLKGLRRVRVRGGIAHAFNGSRQQADEFIRLGFKLGFGGALSFSGSTRIRQLASMLPLDAIVLETDAPDMPPAFIGHSRNSPEYLPRIAGLLAELRGISREQVFSATSANALAVLPSLPRPPFSPTLPAPSN